MARNSGREGGRDGGLTPGRAREGMRRPLREGRQHRTRALSLNLLSASPFSPLLLVVQCLARPKMNGIVNRIQIESFKIKMI